MYTSVSGDVDVDEYDCAKFKVVEKGESTMKMVWRAEKQNGQMNVRGVHRETTLCCFWVSASRADSAGPARKEFGRIRT